MSGRGGPFFKGHHHSDESKRKISEAGKRVVHTKEWNDKMASSLRGKKKSPEAIENVRRALIGRHLSEEHKKKVGDFFRGKSLTEEHRRKIALGNSRAFCEGRSHVGRSGIQGDFYSIKNKRVLHYRSLLELHWYQLLEVMRGVKQYHVEPVIIPYTFEDRIRFYIPDLRVRYMDGTTELIEVKPESRWNDPLNQAKWKAARQWCEKRSIPTVFKVVGFDGLKAGVI